MLEEGEVGFVLWKKLYEVKDNKVWNEEMFGHMETKTKQEMTCW